ncbi:hypothetical protein Sjap_007094 [Stephania japonica]|uniref:Uncharacterized protein n=1 Tax=Stephania japonica TaxID=461633 RepID=A0AAP0JP54_9MAGN
MVYVSSVTTSRFATIGGFVDEIAPPPSSLQPFPIFVEFEFDIHRSDLAYLCFTAVTLLILGKLTIWGIFHNGDLTVGGWPHGWDNCNVQLLRCTPSLFGIASRAFDFPCVSNFYPYLKWWADLINTMLENHLYNDAHYLSLMVVVGSHDENVWIATDNIRSIFLGIRVNAVSQFFARLVRIPPSTVAVTCQSLIRPARQ